MRLPRFSWLVMAGLIAQAAPPVAMAQDVVAGPPVDLSVTVYRDPYRDEGGFDLDYLQGFALITETRRVVLTPGEHRLRFEGVADGIEPATAIVTGLPSGVIEKNRDAMLLSPSALVDAAQGQQGRVLLNRTDTATGRVTRTPATVRSAADGGVVFETAAGIEALRCSGAPETFDFETSASGLAASPTLSVLTRVTERIEAVVQLSYLSSGFDWSADYVADRTASAKTMDLGAWITLANSNSVSFKDARVQIVAGKVNHESGEVEPVNFGGPILAYCWPLGSTSDSPMPLIVGSIVSEAPALSYATRDVVVVTAMKRQESVEDVAVTAVQEDLGDLKLYRVPDRTSIMSRQAKQVRLFDRKGVPVKRVYEVFLSANDDVDYQPMTSIIRTKNDKKNNLGLPLPSGRVQIFETVGTGPSAQRLLAAETQLRDIAVDEETELRLAGGPDIQVRQIRETVEVSKRRPTVPLLRGLNRRTRVFDEVSRIEVTNARAYPVEIELRLYLHDEQELTRADHTVGRKNGQPMFVLTVPANDSVTVRYQTSPK